MDYGKFPKHRGFGPGSAAGAKKARFLDTIDAPFLHHTAPDGTTARKSGFGQLSVTPGAEEELAVDGYYSLGRVNGATRIFGSLDCRTFTDRGPAPAQGGFTHSAVGYYGRGFGFVTEDAARASRVDFDGNTVAAWDSTHLRTRTGRTLVPYAGDQFDLGPRPRAVGRPYMPGGYRYVGDQAVFCRAAIGPMLEGGQYHLGAFTDNGSGTMERVVGPSVPGQILWEVDCDVVAPGTYVAVAKYMRPAKVPTAGAPAACPGLKLYYSTDAGSSWSEGTAAIWQEEMESLTSMPVNPQTTAVFQRAISWTVYTACAIDANRSVVFMTVPRVQHVSGNDYEVYVRVKLGLLDHQSFTITQTRLLWEQNVSPYGAGTLASLRQMMTLPGGGALVATFQGGPSSPVWFRRTYDGTTFEDLGDLGFAAYLTGGMVGIDRKHMGIVLYDGAHSLYETKDGIAWRRRATICENGAAPDPSAYSLLDFRDVTGLRNNNRPLPSRPHAPWVTDCRYEAPVL